MIWVTPHSLQCPNKPQRNGPSLIPDPQAASLLEAGEFPAQEGQAGGLGTDKLKHNVNAKKKKISKCMDYKRKWEKRLIPYSVRGKSTVKFCLGCSGEKRTLTPKGKKKNPISTTWQLLYLEMSFENATCHNESVFLFTSGSYLCTFLEEQLDRQQM